MIRKLASTVLKIYWCKIVTCEFTHKLYAMYTITIAQFVSSVFKVLHSHSPACVYECATLVTEYRLYSFLIPELSKPHTSKLNGWFPVYTYYCSLTKEHPPPPLGPICCTRSFTWMSAHPRASFASALIKFKKHSQSVWGKKLHVILHRRLPQGSFAQTDVPSVVDTTLSLISQTTFSVFVEEGLACETKVHRSKLGFWSGSKWVKWLRTVVSKFTLFGTVSGYVTLLNIHIHCSTYYNLLRYCWLDCTVCWSSDVACWHEWEKS